MKIYTNAGEFLKRTQPFFEVQETMHGLILSMTLRLRDRPDDYTVQPYLATFDTLQGDLILAAAMIPPKNLVLAGRTEPPQCMLDELSEDLYANDWPVGGILSVDELARRFAQTWQRKSGRSYRLNIHMRAYEIRRVTPPEPKPAGFLRQATQADLDILVAWRAAFGKESLHEQPPENLPKLVTEQVKAGKVYLWENGGPVSTAACTRPTQKGIWIHAVYTPPDHRGHGYASGCVAALSQLMLDEGKSYVALYTDIDYPQSNRIYQKIGYLPVDDFSVFQFD
jgi:uncharacterized protein